MLATLIKPAGLAVTVAEAKRHLRIDHDDENENLERIYLPTAIGYVEHETGLRLAPVTLQLRVPGWFYGLKLPAAPVREVERVSYLNESNVEADLAQGAWRAQFGDKRRAEVHMTDVLFTSPALYAGGGDVVMITFTAGFDLGDQTGSGDVPDLELPALARAAVLLLAGHWYENREETVAGALANIAPGVGSICSKLTLW